MNKFSKKILASVILTMLFSLQIIAQEIEEVVVSATKKEQSVQDVPVSIEAFTAEDIDKNLVEDFSDLAEVVPGLIVDKALGSGSAYSMRGVGSYGVGAAVVPSLITSINGHAVGSSALNDTGFHDLERIEVLKGPQGTLSGRNAVQGLVNLVTARPTGELEGSFEMIAGNFNSKRTNIVFNLPVSDKVSMRFATSIFERDGTIRNINSGNDIDGRDSLAGRLSIDFDMNEKTSFEFTYDYQKADDNRQNIGINFCESDPLFGCSPFTVGSIGQTAHPNGSTAGFFNFAAALNSDPTSNSYAGITALNSRDKVNLNRDPSLMQKHELAQIQMNHDLNDNYDLIVKATYTTRDYNHMADNDYNNSTDAFPGLFPAGHPASLIPMEWEGCFGGFHSTFCETVDSDRTYEFSMDETETWQAEVTLISDLDGPLNYQIGYYHFDQTSRNIYQVQTASWNLIAQDGSAHPYNVPLFGGFLTGSGSVDFYIPWALSGFSAAALPSLLTGYSAPVPVQGFFNDDHIRTKSKAILGELYYDLSEQTQITVGLRYNDDVVKDSVFSCLSFTSCTNYPLSQKLTGEYGFFPTQVIEADDAVGYKLAIKHDIDDDRMVYTSYTTAVKAGGNNPNELGIPDPYDQEETAVFEIGAKGIFLDGAMLLNAAYFQNTTDGMLISSIVNAGSKNVNTDAEVSGLEGNMVLFLNETTSIDVTLLKAESEITNLSLINPTNINNASARALLPASLGGGLVQRLGQGGVLTVGATDAGLVYKFAGYLCLEPFNPFGAGCGNPGIPADVSGNKLPQSPELSYSIGLNKDFAGENGKTRARLVYRYMSEREGTVYNQPHLQVPEHKFYDATVTYRPNDGNWFVRLEAKNLADDRYIGSWYLASGLQGGNKFATVTDPLTWGVAFGTSF
ncbi:TonB-dependent receptor plug domain-containing protein [Gammaproteobacteria bacterium]|jgi:iron complex outermembrane receptor protein|nr:TonB-dependent receptor plug domain-containing protein [Gammaproteobacteria bacterium]